MAVIKLQRPKLNFGEKIYFGALIKGFILTMTHASTRCVENPWVPKNSNPPDSA